MRLAKRSPSRLRRTLGLVAGAGALAALGGCQVKEEQPDLVNGKRQFVGKCGSCHILARANAKGVTGPNLDESFQAALRDGLGRDTVRGVTLEQILYPARNGPMPAKLVTGRNARDVAAYVAYAAARPGKDAGALATAVGGGQKPLAVAKGGKLVLPAEPNGQLLYTFKNAQAKPGPLAMESPNPSSVPHNIALEGLGLDVKGPVGQGGSFVSRIEVTVSNGKYTFYCSVPGHRQAGMVGTLTVK